MSTSQRPIVLGVDESAGTEAALQWALDEARTRNAPVHLLCAYRWGLPYRWDAMYANVGDPELRHIQRSAEDLVARTVAAANRIASDVEVTGEAVDGNAAQALVDASSDAALVV
ncbi:MAG: universal stress protein, partial [Sciscionella sp.]